MDNEAPRQTGPPTKPTIPAKVEVEIQRHFNELRREMLDARESHIKHWSALIISGFTLLAIFAGGTFYLDSTRIQESKDKIEKIEEKANKIQTTVEKNAKNAAAYEKKSKEYLESFKKIEIEVKRSAERAADNAKGFDEWGKDIKKKRKELALVRGISAQTADDDSKKAERVIVNVYKNSEASTIDKGIARAISLQQQGNRDRAIAEWQDIAYIAEKSGDNVLAASAQFSIGYLQDKKKSWQDAISAYEKAIFLKPDFPEARKNLKAAKAELERNGDY